MAEKEPRTLRYVGPLRAVTVPALGADGREIRRNHQVKVADPAVAASLLAQADWEEVGAKAAAKADETPAKPEKG